MIQVLYLLIIMLPLNLNTKVISTGQHFFFSQNILRLSKGRIF